MDDIGNINQARKSGKWVVVEEWNEIDFSTGKSLYINKRLVSEHFSENAAFAAFDVCEWTTENQFVVLDPFPRHKKLEHSHEKLAYLEEVNEI